MEMDFDTASGQIPEDLESLAISPLWTYVQVGEIHNTGLGSRFRRVYGTIYVSPVLERSWYRGGEDPLGLALPLSN